MKVLVVAHLYPTPEHRHSMFVHDQVVALRDAGLEMRVVSPTGYAPRLLWHADPRLRRRGRTPARARIDDIEVEYPRVPVLPRRVLFAQSGELSYAALRRRVPAWRAEGFDLLHAHQAMPDGAAAQRLSAALGIPYVVTVHGVDVNVHLGLGGGVAATTAAVLGEAAAVVAVSGAVARRLEGVVAATRLHVINNGLRLDEQVEPDTLAAGRKLILSVGNLIASKGNAIVIEALSRLVVDRHPDLEYAVVGEGPVQAELQELALMLGVGERVHFLGHLPRERVIALMARADAFVLPSSPEGFGLVWAEAMAQGTPVVACVDEGPRDFIEDGVSGLLVPPRDVEAVEQAIDRLLGDAEAARRMGEAGRRAVARLTWERNAELQAAVYDEVLARRGGSAAASPCSSSQDPPPATANASSS